MRKKADVAAKKVRGFEPFTENFGKGKATFCEHINTLSEPTKPTIEFLYGDYMGLKFSLKEMPPDQIIRLTECLTAFAKSEEVDVRFVGIQRPGHVAAWYAFFLAAVRDFSLESCIVELKRRKLELTAESSFAALITRYIEWKNEI